MPEATPLLDGVTVVDFSQFLAGPSASLRLADLGADVIKVERPVTGDICRTLYVSDTRIDGDSTIFHAINRNKRGYLADLKDPADRERIERLVSRADVVMHNFRPGVIDRLGVGYERVRELNPTVVYGEISGYGTEGPWATKPGQDLLLQAMSGLSWLSGDAGDGPVPMGVAVVDIWAGALLTEGILAALVRRGITGAGALVEVNMLEAALDLQMEPMTVFLQGGVLPQRSRTNGGHPLLAAPYGIYVTADGYLALAMGQIPRLGELLDCPPLLDYPEPASWFDERDAIKAILADHLRTRPTQAWLEILEAADIWCAAVLDWEALVAHPAFQQLGVLQTVERGTGTSYATTVCPIRVDGHKPRSSLGSNRLGEHDGAIDRELGLR
jgi:crotonobetainyl-CoA:carnitine CoA-transferase CaiB-like acyl-CoA transferase